MVSVSTCSCMHAMGQTSRMIRNCQRKHLQSQSLALHTCCRQGPKGAAARLGSAGQTGSLDLICKGVKGLLCIAQQASWVVKTEGTC